MWACISEQKLKQRKAQKWLFLRRPLDLALRIQRQILNVLFVSSWFVTLINEWNKIKKAKRSKTSRLSACEDFMYCSQVSKQAYSKMKKSDMFQKHRFSAEIMALKKKQPTLKTTKRFFSFLQRVENKKQSVF